VTVLVVLTVLSAAVVYLWMDRNAWRAESQAAVVERDQLRWVVQNVHDNLQNAVRDTRRTGGSANVQAYQTL
jgi:outer membrane murein-binding lipoprotein Lpp